MAKEENKTNYITALTWLERSKYDVIPTLIKNEVKIDTIIKPDSIEKKGELVESETIPHSTSTVGYVQNKIINLYNW